MNTTGTCSTCSTCAISWEQLHHVPYHENNFIMCHIMRTTSSCAISWEQLHHVPYHENNFIMLFISIFSSLESTPRVSGDQQMNWFSPSPHRMGLLWRVLCIRPLCLKDSWPQKISGIVSPSATPLHWVKGQQETVMMVALLLQEDWQDLITR